MCIDVYIICLYILCNLTARIGQALPENHRPLPFQLILETQTKKHYSTHLWKHSNMRCFISIYIN